jgi:hypothetical protein
VAVFALADALKEWFDYVVPEMAVVVAIVVAMRVPKRSKTNAHGEPFRSMAIRTSEVQRESNGKAVPWQLANRNGLWSSGGFFQHSAG